ncbi:MAG: hypothetical protein IPP07_28640 [Holophagales bacterium]|nr:hypothetical protein [Holophagales bacterium]
MTVGGFFKQWFGGGAQSSLPSRARGPNTPGDDGARAPVGSALEEGVALARAGQHERAATCFRHYLASCPASAVGHLNLGSTLQDQARLEAGAANRRELIEALAREAAREFEAALSCDPGFGGIGRAMALIGLGRMHLVLGEFPVATRVLLTVLELPDVDRATKDAAREALARVHFRETIGEGSIPREDEERRAALFADASRLLEGRLTSKDGSPLPKPGVKEVASLGKAREALGAALAIAPNDWPSHWMLGMVERRLGDERSALDHFKRAWVVNPYNPNVGREASISAGRLGRGEDAVRYARSAVAADPDDPGLFSNLAVSLLLVRDGVEALRLARLASGRVPGDRVSRDVLGLVEDVVRGRKPFPERIPQ